MAKQDEGLDVSFGDTSSKKNKEWVFIYALIDKWYIATYIK
jgi:hypothetical protein